MTNHNITNTQPAPIRKTRRPKNPVQWRVLWAAMIMTGLLTAVPGFALTVDQTRDASAYPAPRPYEQVADQGADACRSLLEERTAGPATATQASPQRAAVPAALVGYMLGARYATGPRENPGLIHVAAAGAQFEAENKVQAIAAYRRCRAEHMLQALSQ